VIAANRRLETATAAAISSLFVECIAAPGFEDGALEILAKKKNLRLVEMPDLAEAPAGTSGEAPAGTSVVEPDFGLRSITRGVLKQSVDSGDPEGTQWQVVSARQPTESEWQALRFAWKACQHVKSNAIVFARAEGAAAATVGIGGGQPNRVDCVRIASERAGAKSRGAVMASDAFFPFPDSLDVAAAAGITAAVHPGGSVRDAESVAAADAHHMALVVTGVRHFRH
jgi:phosphoribosylaminoimidazolecarboxamide formyltransferase/IMP cyclohydrolase